MSSARPLQRPECRTIGELAVVFVGAVLFASLMACAAPSAVSSPSPSDGPSPIEAKARLIRASAAGAPTPGSGVPPQATPLTATTGLYVSARELPKGHELDEWAQSLSQSGLTMVLLEAGTREGVELGTQPDRTNATAGVYFRTRWAPLRDDLFGELVPMVHRHGLTVFAVVSLRSMNWVDPALGWFDRLYDPVRSQITLSPHLDLLHPAYQEYLVGFLADLAGTGIDGVLFRNEALGPLDGFSPFALSAFEEAFHIRADPADLVPPALTSTASNGAQTREPAAVKSQYTAEFWRWAGWKTRAQLKAMDQLCRALRARAPRLRMALQVRPETVTDPVRALVNYGEDLLEAKRMGFDFFLTRPVQMPTLSRPGVQDQPEPPSFLDKMSRLLGGPGRIWLAVPVSKETMQAGRPGGSFTPRAAPAVGLIYMTD